jgi:hypothetical protein
VSGMEGVRGDLNARKALDIRAQIELVRSQTSTLPAGGEAIGKMFNRSREIELANLNTRQALNSAGMSSSVRDFMKVARSRVLADKYGKSFGALAEKADDLMPSSDLARESSVQAAATVSRISGLRDLMNARAVEGQFAEAAGLQQEINKERGKELKWLNPEIYFRNEDNARAAARMFPATQSMKRLRSYE